MTNDSFWVTAAAVLPVLLLAMVVEDRLQTEAPADDDAGMDLFAVLTMPLIRLFVIGMLAVGELMALRNVTDPAHPVWGSTVITRNAAVLSLVYLVTMAFVASSISARHTWAAKAQTAVLAFSIIGIVAVGATWT